jgi:aminoglycoside phosphotransferase (APT) family kinase protein
MREAGHGDTGDRDLHGLDSAAVSGWLTRHVDAARAPYEFSLIPGGESNLTYRITDADGRGFVLRRPPTGELAVTAHDVFREARIMTQLAGTAVPVPDVLGTCDDPAVTGGRFFVMGFVAGHVLRTAAGMQVLPLATRAAACTKMIGTLAAIHQVDLASQGLSDLGPPAGYIARQLRRWRRQLDEATAPGRDALIDLHDLLASSAPASEPPTALIHGDFRFDNAVVSDDGQVRAVLDWELATLGNPLADLGITLAAWSGPGEQMGFGQPGPTSAPGCLTQAEAEAAYASVTGHDVAGLPWYIAWANWRIACLLAGVYARRRDGAYGAGGYSLEQYAAELSRRADLARLALSPA